MTPDGTVSERPKLILLVEDDPLSLKLMRDVLQAHGYETSELSNGTEVLAVAGQRVPDLIVMDVGLPGMDGVEVTKSLKGGASTRNVPVLAVTAYAMPADEERMRNAGCDAFLTKPLRFSEFVAVVQGLLGISLPAG
jgi:two-component system cell cycle response regulator DivK